MSPFRMQSRSLVAIGLLLTITILTLGGWALMLRLSGNVHAVVEGQIYRSAQLSPDHLRALIREEGLRTIINLRGEQADAEWYRTEHATADAAGLHYVSIPLSANEEPNEATLQSLIDVMRSAEPPVLIHCEGGADRSGLASALYRLMISGDEAGQAAGQLSFRYGHFPWLVSRSGAMDRAFWRVADAPERFKGAE